LVENFAPSRVFRLGGVYQAALTYLQRDPGFYVDMITLLERGSAVEVVADGAGVVLRDAWSGGWFLAADSAARAAALVRHVHDTHHLVVHEEVSLPVVEEYLGFAHHTSC
jgi:hypothetical protein